MSIIKNIVFDIGNVLVGFNSERALKNLLPHSSFHNLYLEQFIGKDIWLKLDAGAHNISSAIESFLVDCADIKSLSNKEKSKIRSELHHFLTYFVDDMQVNLPCQRLFEALLTRYNCYILSNFQETAFRRLKKQHPFLLQAKGLIISAKVSWVKPQKEIYQHLLKTYYLEASETLFIDDLCENIIAAQSQKIQGIVFETPEQLFEDLEKLKIFVPEHVKNA